MPPVETLGNRGLNILLASSTPVDVYATVRGIQRAFPLPKGRRDRNFFIVREFAPDSKGQNLGEVDIYEFVEHARERGDLARHNWYTGPFISLENVRRFIPLAPRTFRAVAPHVLIVAQYHEPDGSKEVNTLQRGFIAARLKVDAAIRRVEHMPEPLEDYVALGIRDTHTIVGQELVHMEYVVARDTEGRETFSSSASGGYESRRRVEGDLIPGDGLLIHPIEIALHTLDARIRSEKEDS